MIFNLWFLFVMLNFILFLSNFAIFNSFFSYCCFTTILNCFFSNSDLFPISRIFIYNLHNLCCCLYRFWISIRWILLYILTKPIKELTKEPLLLLFFLFFRNFLASSIHKKLKIIIFRIKPHITSKEKCIKHLKWIKLKKCKIAFIFMLINLFLHSKCNYSIIPFMTILIINFSFFCIWEYSISLRYGFKHLLWLFFIIRIFILE